MGRRRQVRQRRIRPTERKKKRPKRRMENQRRMARRRVPRARLKARAGINRCKSRLGLSHPALSLYVAACLHPGRQRRRCVRKGERRQPRRRGEEWWETMPLYFLHRSLYKILYMFIKK